MFRPATMRFVRAGSTRRLAFAALAVAFLVLGCSRDSKRPFEPEVVADLPPDLRANEGFLYWPDISIGAPARAPARAGRADLAGRAARAGSAWSGATQSFADSIVVVGTGALPAVRQVCTGSFPDYRVHFYVNGRLWWDRASSATSPRGTWLWESFYGMPWVPADTGTYVIRVVLDATHRHQEADETNNEIRYNVRVVLGDLAAGLLEFVEWRDGYPYRVDHVRVGTPIQVVVWSFARGDYSNHRAVLEAGGSALLDHRVSLRGGTLWPDIRTDTLAYIPSAPGSVEFRFTVDPDAEFRDANRGNNVALRALTVVP